MTNNKTVLSLKNLVKKFDEATVLKGINAEVQQGEVIGLLGLNGAGKTTLLETALGFCIPDNGHSFLWGADSTSADFNAVKSRIGFVPQQDELMETIKGRQYLHLISQFYPNWNQELVDRLASEWDVPVNTGISKLSVGQRQKLSILAALGHEPELIILDEPVASLDPLARRQFLKELIDIASERTRTILFSTHIVSDLERVASRVWLMKDGHIVVDEELEVLKEHNARISLEPGKSISADFLKSKKLHARMEQNTQVIFAPEFCESLADEIRQQANCSVTVMPLALEDIFLELHQ